MVCITDSQIHSPLKLERDQEDVVSKTLQLRERLSEEMFYRWHWIFTAGYF